MRWAVAVADRCSCPAWGGKCVLGAGHSYPIQSAGDESPGAVP
jgi:hypothetical protein